MRGVPYRRFRSWTPLEFGRMVQAAQATPKDRGESRSWDVSSLIATSQHYPPNIHEQPSNAVQNARTTIRSCLHFNTTEMLQRYSPRHPQPALEHRMRTSHVGITSRYTRRTNFAPNSHASPINHLDSLFIPIGHGTESKFDGSAAPSDKTCRRIITLTLLKCRPR